MGAHEDDSSLRGLPAGIFDRWAAGQPLPGDEAAIQCWIAESAENAALLRALLEATAGSEPSEDWNEEQRWQNLARTHRLDAHVPTPKRSRPVRQPRIGLKPTPSRWRRAAMVAGIVLVVGGLGAVLVRGTSSDSGAVVQAEPEHSFVAQNGERATIRLADGTDVTLLPGSALHVPDSYGKGPRSVHLDGAALFSVVHDTEHPFRVTTTHAVMRDLGTRFAIRAYPELPRTEVVVEHGTVSVARRDSDVAAPSVLHARDRAELGAGGPLLVQHNVDLDDALRWTRGDLAFDGTPLHQVVQALEREYGITIRMPKRALEERRITVSLPRMALDELVSALGIALGMDASRNGRTITFAERR